MNSKTALNSRNGLILLAAIVLIAFMAGYFSRGNRDSGEIPGEHEHSGSVTAEVSQTALWTCSMHPQIKLPSPGKCPICFMDLIPVETGSGDDRLEERQLRMTPAAIKLAGIVTAPVTRGFVEAEIRVTGDITNDETRVTYISSRMPGRLDRLFADYTGIEVKKGDPLVSIYSPDLVGAQEELLQAAVMNNKEKGSNRFLEKGAEPTLAAAREKLRLLGFDKSQIEQIESSGKTTDHMTIFSPAEGTVIEKSAFEGMYVETGTKIYTISKMSSLWVNFDVFQSDLPWLREGQPVEFATPSHPGEKFTGIISFIDPVFDDETRTVSIRAEFDNSGGRLKPGMFVSGNIKARLDRLGRAVDDRAADLSEAPLVIPATSALLTGTRAVVYVRLPGGSEPLFEGREIALGPRAGEYYIVRSGLEEGDLVVVNGAFKIDSELQIRARPGMMSSIGSGTPRSSKENEEKAGHQVRRQGFQSLGPVYESYFAVQMALAGDDLVSASKGNAALVNALRQVDRSLFEGKLAGSWKKLSADLVREAEAGESARTISESREAFYNLSKSMISLHDNFGHPGKNDFFLTYCPMADGNRGAFWLQAVDTVYNSFYGASMLRCGSIEKTLPPAR
ncbi:MAG: efflux RND transporter periplasmic adaptor subunit [Candidatus Krumholzibacteriota bacterium]|nr:efflux RND transporter periplasmic adaptor subunit [Candidatus Krumholzibacteriota bacterium]